MQTCETLSLPIKKCIVFFETPLLHTSALGLFVLKNSVRGHFDRRHFVSWTLRLASFRPIGTFIMIQKPQKFEEILISKIMKNLEIIIFTPNLSFSFPYLLLDTFLGTSILTLALIRSELSYDTNLKTCQPTG